MVFLSESSISARCPREDPGVARIGVLEGAEPHGRNRESPLSGHRLAVGFGHLGSKIESERFVGQSSGDSRLHRLADIPFTVDEPEVVTVVQSAKGRKAVQRPRELVHFDAKGSSLSVGRYSCLGFSSLVS